MENYYEKPKVMERVLSYSKPLIVSVYLFSHRCTSDTKWKNLKTESIELSNYLSTSNQSHDISILFTQLTRMLQLYVTVVCQQLRSWQSFVLSFQLFLVYG